MEGQARTAGRLRESITVGEREYAISPPGHMELLNELQACVVSQRPNPLVLLAEALAAIPCEIAEQRRIEIETRLSLIAEDNLLKRGRVSESDLKKFMATPEAISVTMLACCPELTTRNEAGKFVSQVIMEGRLPELEAKLTAVSGAVEAKNSSGPPRKRTGRGKEKKSRGSNSQGRRKSTST